MGGGSEAGNAGIAREVKACQITGVDKGRGRRGALGTALGEGEAIGGAAQGGYIAEVVGELPADHEVELAYDQEEGGVTDKIYC